MADFKAENVKAGDLPIKGTEDAPFLFVDGYAGVANANGVVRFRLTRLRLDSEGKPYNEVVAVLGLSVPSMLSVHSSLTNLVKEMEEDGTLSMRPAKK